MKKVKHFCCLVSIILILLCSVSFGACSHPVSKRITKREATCTETGLAQIRCASCDALIKPVTIPKKAHSYKAATCTKPKTCSSCGATSGQKLGHNWNVTSNNQEKVGSSSVCTRTTTKYKCSRCGISREEIKPVMTHSFTSSSCTEPKKCSVCGYAEGTASGHKETTDWGKEASYHYKLCTVCNQKLNISSHTYTWKYDSNQHYQECTVCKYQSGFVKHTFNADGKCITCGYTEKVTTIECTHKNVVGLTCLKNGKCQDCGQEIKAKGHTYSGSAGYSSDSKGHYKHCEVCDAVSPTIEEHKASTWKHSSSEHYKKCTVCGYRMNAGSHTYDSNGKCTVCGYVNAASVCPHTTSTRKTTKEATCASAGKYEIRCSKCNELIDTGEIPKKPHTASSDWSYDSKEHYKKCTECNQKISSTVTSHVIDSSTYKCICGYIDKSSMPKCEHKNVIDLTCEKDGKCLDCGEVIKAKGHIYTGKAGYSSDSKGHYMHCQTCNAVSPKYEKHQMNSSTNSCDICGWVCKYHSYKLVNDKNGKYYECQICGYAYMGGTTECEHEYVLKKDYYGHYTICSKCGYRDMYNSKGKIDTTKYGAHHFGETVDLCNGKHRKICNDCNYKAEAVHIYMDVIGGSENNKYIKAKKVCIVCGSTNYTGLQDVNNDVEHFDVESEDAIKEIQTILAKKGYNVGEIDGKYGKKTQAAINELLKNQGSTLSIDGKNDITDAVYTFIKNCKETKEESAIRMANQKLELLRGKLNAGEATQEDKIMLLKSKLFTLGYYQGVQNGENDADFKYAMKTFLSINGMGESGYDISDMSLDMILKILDETKTYTDKKVDYLEDIISGKEKVDLANNETQCRILQETLKILGYYTGTVDGKVGSGTKTAIRNLLNDKGLSKIDIGSNYEGVNSEVYKLMLLTEEKGLEEFVRTDPNDNSWLGAVFDVKRYYATHGFKYNKDVPHEIIPSKQKKYGDAYRTDCSTAVTAYLYYYAQANGCETMMNEFSLQKSSKVYVQIAKNNGIINGIKYFEVIEDSSNVQKGDILAVNGHVEVYAGETGKVYNAGDDTSIESEGKTKSSHNFGKYKYLRPISPEEVQKIDGQN